MAPIRIIQISDTHFTDLSPEIDANFDHLVSAIRDAKPDFVIHTGDVTRDAPGNPHELSYAVQRLSAISQPLYVLPGNHDVGDNPNDSDVVPRSLVQADLARAFCDHFGSDRFVFQAGDWCFVGLNAQLFGSGLEEEEAQWEWARAAFTSCVPTALFLHKPLFHDDPNEEVPVAIRFVPKRARERLLEFMAQASVRAVGTGHTHQSRRVIGAGALHVWCPAAAFVLPDTIQPPVGQKFCGALEWTFGSNAEVTCQPLDAPGIRTLSLGDLPGLYSHH